MGTRITMETLVPFMDPLQDRPLLDSLKWLPMKSRPQASRNHRKSAVTSPLLTHTLLVTVKLASTVWL